MNGAYEHFRSHQPEHRPDRADLRLRPAGADPSIIEDADRAYQQWRDTPVAKRAEVLRTAADIFDSRVDELAAIIGREMGKPHAQGVKEANKVAFTMRWYADNGPGFLEPTELPEAQGAERTYVKHDPWACCWASCRGTSPTTRSPGSRCPT